MNNKLVGNILIAGGLLLLVVSAAADMIGLGEGTVFGWKQVAGCVLGVLDIVAGALLNTRQPPSE